MTSDSKLQRWTQARAVDAAGWWENESARDLLGVSGASFLKNSQSSQILNREFHRRSATDLRRLSILQRPSRQASAFRWESGPPAVPAINDRLASAIHPSAVPAANSQLPRLLHSPAPLLAQPPTCVGTFILQLPRRTNLQPFVDDCIVRLYLPTVLQLAPATRLPFLPLDRLPAFAFRCPSGFALDQPSDSRRKPYPSALPSNPTSDSSSELVSSGFALRLTSGLRLRSALRLFR